MPYTLLGMVGRNLTELHRSIPYSALIELPQGLWMLPLTRPLLASIAELAYTKYYPDTFSWFFSESVANKLSQMSKQTFAYLEIDCEGGDCQRTAVLFRNGSHIWSATEDWWVERAFQEAGLSGDYVSCTNQALRLLGVQAGDAIDELAALGLTKPPFRTAWHNFESFELDRPEWGECAGDPAT